MRSVVKITTATQRGILTTENGVPETGSDASCGQIHFPECCATLHKMPTASSLHRDFCSTMMEFGHDYMIHYTVINFPTIASLFVRSIMAVAVDIHRKSQQGKLRFEVTTAVLGPCTFSSSDWSDVGTLHFSMKQG